MVLSSGLLTPSAIWVSGISGCGLLSSCFGLSSTPERSSLDDTGQEVDSWSSYGVKSCAGSQANADLRKRSKV